MPDSTTAPLAAWTELTTPSRGHMISFSIFMASRTMRTSPFFTLWPAATFTARMVPGMGDVILSPSPAGAAGAAGAGAAGFSAAGAAGAAPVISSSSTS